MDPIAVPWATGFENGFCDYEQVGGFFVGDGNTRPSPHLHHDQGVRRGVHGATPTRPTTRRAACARGVLPQEAYYGAWYYVADSRHDRTDDSLWNLWHFQGGDVSTKGLWDISLVKRRNGELELLVFDFLKGVVRKQSRAKPITIPIGSWFHIQFYLKRAADATGAIRLYQDNQLLFEATASSRTIPAGVNGTSATSASSLTPPDSTLYVDDVTIDTQRR